jgi:predicted AAA+ superfamily ATPase
MKRTILPKLIEWKSSPSRKPLIIKGARQVGKTYIVEAFGNAHYDNLAVFDFMENPEFAELFEMTNDPHRIIENLALASGQTITPGNTLIFFDEVQESPKVIQSLKYFNQNANDYHVVAAGSLLGISLAKPQSFPVGKVNFMQLYPMSFEEFLLAIDKQNLVDYLHQIQSFDAIPGIFHSQLTDYYNQFMVVGGMPEAVKTWVETKDINRVDSVLDDLILSYRNDFVKHTDPREFAKISLVFDSLPSQLAKENRKFLYQLVKQGARAREYEDAIQWLVNAEIINKVNRIEQPKISLSSYDDLSAFKLYLLDVGLLRRLVKVPSSAFVQDSPLFTELKGAMTENYVLQGLTPQLELAPRYWSRLNPSYEVDFVIQHGLGIYPIEVKSGTVVKSRSLAEYAKKFGDVTTLKLRLSKDNLTLDDNLLNLPLYMINQLTRMIDLAKDKQS